MDHWCRRPSAFSNMSVAAWKELAIPRYTNGNYSRCTFDLNQHGNTAVSDWSVVCQRRHLADAAQAAYLFAMTVTLMAVGPIADRIGRKTVGILALAALLPTLAATGVASDLQTFIIVRSVTAAASAGLFVIRVLLFEITTTARRLLYTTIGSTLSFLIPRLFLSLAYVSKASWSSWHMLLAFFALVLLAAFRVLDESPSWLIAVHREDEAGCCILSSALDREVGGPQLTCFDRSLETLLDKAGKELDLLRLIVPGPCVAEGDRLLETCPSFFLGGAALVRDVADEAAQLASWTAVIGTGISR
ncbi:organic cation transporter protein-like [Dermacentor silvarum]|uniref:organic cation transporter protein-like n=1 Tax=Dermacentor silvarum TaxID=543639 RepID=UPI002101694D|nr:organic cation transporter protein-like [Dermacentor silvarum]